jgi:septal ring factor EnvC (AmiA/AmiB activator)
MKKFVKFTLAVSILAGSLMLASCSSAPSEEEMMQLNTLKQQVADLEKQIAEKKSEKATIEKQIAEKNGKLQQCQSDQEAVKKGLGQ